MNYLAHIYLSQKNEPLMIGNFIADFVKGKIAYDAFPNDIKEGINLHREIDAYTDRHPIVKEGVKRLYDKHGRYGSVIVDIYYDYLLIHNWEKYTTEPLEDYVQQAYATIEKYNEVIPPKLRKNLPYMIADNWLMRYGTWEGLAFTFSKIQNRVRYTDTMQHATIDLQEQFDQFNEEFNIFFPDVINFVATKISDKDV